MNATAKGFRHYFDSLTKAWRDQYGCLPKVPFEEELESELLAGVPDKDGLVEWLPKENTQPPRIDVSAECQISSAIADYLGSYRFLVAGGRLVDYSIQLTPITMAFITDELPKRLSAYRDSHLGSLQHVPIGVETNSGNLVVLENTTENAAVFIEDFELKQFIKIADSPSEMLLNLKP